MAAAPQPVRVYVDDGHPESRDYDDNYRFVEPVQQLGLVAALVRHRSWRRAKSPGDMLVVAVDPGASVALPG